MDVLLPADKRNTTLPAPHSFPYEQTSTFVDRTAGCLIHLVITGVAGFIGSNLLEALLKLDQRVIGMDNFSTGHQRNLDEVRNCVSAGQWAPLTIN